MVNTETRLIIFLVAKDGKALCSHHKQDQELTVAQIMNSSLQNLLTLKKVGKTTREFRYDLNKIPYDYIVKVRNRFKGLDLIDRVPKELRTEVCYNVQGAVTKIIQKEKKKWKKARWLPEVAL